MERKAADARPLVAVCGATGKQGGAVARALVNAGFRIRGLTRAPDSEAARKLERLGVEMRRADLEDRSALEAAFDGAWGVFSVQNYYEKGVGYEGEVRQGRNVVDAAVAAGARHLTQSTMADALDADEVLHFRSKFEIERLIRQSGLSHTLLGTVWFMDNLHDQKMGGEMNFMRDLAHAGKIAQGQFIARKK
jgi:uncharacterized protein YbjT (DUF2867 family)